MEKNLNFMINRKSFFIEILQLMKSHYKLNAKYKKFLDNSSIKLNTIKKIENLPFLHINIFKFHSLVSGSFKKVVTKLSSSGTSGQRKSTIYLDKQNVILQKKTLLNLLKQNISKERLPMIILDKNPNFIDKSHYSAKIAAIYGFSLIGKNYFYLIKKNGQIDYQGFNKFLKKNKYKKIFLFGFTYDVFINLIKNFKQNIKINLNNSILLHGGGWKKMEGLKISKSSFKSKLRKKFNIKKIINYYGVVEQTGSVFFECDECNKLITNQYADVIIRNTNLDPCDNNEQGLIQLLSTVPRSYPGNSILSEDLGILYKNKCKIHKKYKSFGVLGRIKKVEVRGCSDAN